MISIAIILVFIGGISFILSAWLARPDAPIRILDQPNERSLHAVPTPRTGGIAICAALMAGWVAFATIAPSGSIPEQILIGAVIVAAVSILDDLYGLSQMLRLLVQFGAALILVQGGFALHGDLAPGLALSPGLVTIAVTVVMTIWLINLYNFMDGMDGFAGGMAVIGFGTLAILGWCQDDSLFAGSALAVSAAAAGFLWFNFPPSRIFMGDSGSTTLGFLAAAFTVWGSRCDVAPVWLSLVVFSPFVVDATVTLIGRALSGEPVWRAHRSHFYQRLVQLGWGHRRTVIVEYVVMLICAASAVFIVDRGVTMQWIMLVVLVSGYVISALGISRMERRC